MVSILEDPRTSTKGIERLKGQYDRVAPSLDGECILPPGIDLPKTMEMPWEALSVVHRARSQAYADILRNGGETRYPNGDRLFYVKVLNNLQKYLKQENDLQAPTLRTAQLRIFSEMLEHLEAGEKRGYLKLPTGFGKTVMFLLFALHSNTPASILIPKLKLRDQTEEKADQFTSEMYRQIVKGQTTPNPVANHLLTYQYLTNAAFDGRYDMAQRFLWILDEAHKGLGPGFQKVIRKISPQSLLLAFTATPFYSETRSVPHIMNASCWSEIKVDEAIRMGALAPTTTFVANVDVDLKDVPVNEQGKYDEKELDKTLIQGGIAQSASKLYKKSFSGQSAIAFCGSRAFSRHTAKVFNDAGIPAAAIDSDTPQSQRDQIFADYKAGKIKMLCSADLLIEGFDEPRASVCFNLVETESIVDAEQRGGRTSRLDPDNPDKLSVVVDFIYKGVRSSRMNSVLYYQILGNTVCPNFEDLPLETRRKVMELQGSLLTNDIPGLRVKVQAEEVLKVQHEIDPIASLAEAPEGWLSLVNLASHLEIPRDRVSKIIGRNPDHYRGLHGRFRHGQGRFALNLYHPDIIEKIKESIADDPRERGWISENSVKEYFGRRSKTTARLESWANEEKNEDKWEVFRVRSDYRTTYYHPDILEDLADLKIPTRKPDYHKVNFEHARQRLRLTKPIIKAAFENCREQDPDTSDALTPSESSMYAHRDFYPQVAEEAYALIERPRAGRATISELAQMVGIATPQVQKVAAPIILDPYQCDVALRDPILQLYKILKDKGEKIGIPDLTIRPTSGDPYILRPPDLSLMIPNLITELQNERDFETSQVVKTPKRSSSKVAWDDRLFQMISTPEARDILVEKLSGPIPVPAEDHLLTPRSEELVLKNLSLQNHTPPDWWKPVRVDAGQSGLAHNFAKSTNDSLWIADKYREILPTWMILEFKNPEWIPAGNQAGILPTQWYGHPVVFKLWKDKIL